MHVGCHHRVCDMTQNFFDVEVVRYRAQVANALATHSGAFGFKVWDRGGS